MQVRPERDGAPVMGPAVMGVLAGVRVGAAFAALPNTHSDEQTSIRPFMERPVSP
jgi:hypothetical protein